jgi:hypothetical protein
MMLRILAIFVLALVVCDCSAATYYIDYNGGKDSNGGTSKGGPWKHCPAMQPFSGWSKYQHQPGDRFIFKGGVTWPVAALPLYIWFGGAPDNYDYYGADVTWFEGSQFSRPIFSAEWQPFTNWGGNRENMIFCQGSRSRYIQFDNLQIQRWRTTNPLANDTDCAGINVYSSGNIRVTNCYIGDWRPANSREGGGGVIGSYDIRGPIDVIDCKIEGPLYIDPALKWDPYGFTSGSGVKRGGLIERCDISRTSQGVSGANIVRDCVIHDGGQSFVYGHENLIDCFGANMDVYRCVAYNWTGVGVYFRTGWSGRSSTMRAWNNIFWNTAQHQLSNEQGLAGNTSSVVWINNIVVGRRVTIDHKNSADFGGPVIIANNLFVNDVGDSVRLNDSIANLRMSNNATLTFAQAASRGMTESNRYQNTSPIPSATDQGTRAYSFIFSDDFKRVSRPQGSAWDIGAYEYFMPAPQNLRITSN